MCAPPVGFACAQSLCISSLPLAYAKMHKQGVTIIPEPLDKWQETGIFEAFYKDMTRWSFTFQVAAFVSRVQAAEEALKDHSAQAVIGERSWCADAYVFEPLLHRDGHISQIEHATYQDWWRWVADRSPKMSGIIYLRARADTCLERIQKRSREAEAGIPLAYLEGLFEQHEKWLVDKCTAYGPHHLPVLVLDADVEFEGDPVVLQNMLQQITDFTADPQKYVAAAAAEGAESQAGVSPDACKSAQRNVSTIRANIPHALMHRRITERRDKRREEGGRETEKLIRTSS